MSGTEKPHYADADDDLNGDDGTQEALLGGTTTSMDSSDSAAGVSQPQHIVPTAKIESPPTCNLNADGMSSDFSSETSTVGAKRSDDLEEAGPPPLGIRTPFMDDNDGDAEDSSDSNDGHEVVIMPPLLRSLSRAPSRMRTRLQDPPPIIPAIKRQLTHSRSSLLNKTIAPSSTSASSEHIKHVKNPKNDACSGTTEKKNVAEDADPAIANPNDLPYIAAPGAVEDCDNLDDEIMPDKKEKLKENKSLVYLQLMFLIVLIAFLVCSYKLEILSKQMFLDFHLWRWEALTLVVFCGHLFSGWIVKLLTMLIERHYVLKKRVLYFLYGLRKSVKNCVWLALVLGVWESIHEGHDGIMLVNILSKILWCLFIVSVSWMFKILAVKVAANSFHRKAYFERIQESVYNQHLLEILSAPPQMADAVDSRSITRRHSKNKKNKKIKFSDEQLNAGQSSPKEDTEPYARKSSSSMENESPSFTTVEVGELPMPRSSSDLHASNRPAPLIARSPIPIAQNKLQELTADTVSVGTLKSLMKVVRKTNISTYSSMLSHETKDREINSESEAKAAAKQIFYNMARPGQKTLVMKNFQRFLHGDQAMRAVSLFEVTESGEITKQALAKWVITVFKERRALALTLNDSKTVVAKLHKVLDVVLFLVLIIVALLIFGIETSKLLVFFSSVFIPSVFVFGNSARTTFEALIFLFVIHPYDVGDRVVVDGQGMIVEV